MSNASVVTSIRNLLRRFEAREVPTSTISEQIADYVSALEGLRGENLRALRDTANRLEFATFADKEFPGENPQDVLRELHALLDSVPQ